MMMMVNDPTEEPKEHDKNTPAQNLPSLKPYALEKKKLKPFPSLRLLPQKEEEPSNCGSKSWKI